MMGRQVEFSGLKMVGHGPWDQHVEGDTAEGDKALIAILDAIDALHRLPFGPVSLGRELHPDEMVIRKARNMIPSLMGFANALCRNLATGEDG